MNEVRSEFGFDHDANSNASALYCKDPSLTVQSQSEDADINVIVRRFGITGQLPARSSVPLVTNGDFVEVTDFRSAMDVVRAGEEAFAAMPVEVRDRFANDAGKFVDFMSRTDDDALREMVKLGLAVERVVTDPKKLQVLDNSAGKDPVNAAVVKPAEVVK